MYSLARTRVLLPKVSVIVRSLAYFFLESFPSKVIRVSLLGRHLATTIASHCSLALRSHTSPWPVRCFWREFSSPGAMTSSHERQAGTGISLGTGGPTASLQSMFV